MSADAPPGLVLIVDDDDSVRAALGLLMDSAGLHWQGFESGCELLESTAADTPACVILDVRLPGLTGFEVQDLLREQDSLLPIIFLTGQGDIASAVSAVQKGALGFLEKTSFAPTELLRLVRTGIDLHRQRLEAQARNRRIRERIHQLSPREHEVACLAAHGHANKVIAGKLGISERTVEVHRGRAMKKLRLRSVAELARLRELVTHRADTRLPG